MDAAKLNHCIFFFAIALSLLTAPFTHASEYNIELPVVIDNLSTGNMAVTIKDNAIKLIETESWKAIAEEHFSQDVVSATLRLDEKGAIPVGSLRKAGIDITFDPRTLQIMISPQENQRRSRNLAMRSEIPSGNLETPDASFTSYTNARYVQDYVVSSEIREPGRSDAILLLGGAIRLPGARSSAFEWEALYDEAANQEWKRGEMRLVYDLVESATRLSAGDIRYTSSRFQGAPPLLGLSAERQYSTIQPTRVVSSAGQQSFTLSAPANVAIYVNDFLQSRQRLSPGRYSVEDFSPSSGLNDIRIEIEDDAGRVEIINFSLFLDATLLREGLSEYSINAGIQREEDFNEKIRYDTSRPAWSGFYRYGLTPRLTTGLQYQGDKDIDVIGLEAVVGTSNTGTWAAAYANSSHEMFGNANSANMSWSYENDFFSTGHLQYLNLSSLYSEEEFLTLGQDDANNSYEWQNRLQVSSSLLNEIYASLSFNYSTRHQTDTSERGVSASLSKQFGQTAINLRAERTLGVENDSRVFLSASLPIGNGLRSRNTYDSFRETFRTEISSSPRNTVGDLSGYLAAEVDEKDSRLDGAFAYRGNRFIARGEHNYISPGNFSGSAEQIARLQLETSFANVGKTFAFGRPVSNSFALVQRHESLSDTSIHVNETFDGPLAKADSFGPAVLSSLESYRPYQINWRALEPPAGYDLGNTERLVKPYHRSGFLFTVGSSASAVAIGVATDDNNEPIALTAGTIRAMENSDFPELRTFTNRKGRFVAQGLEPGDYEVEFGTEPPTTFSFSIPEGAIGYVDLGNLGRPQ